MKNGEDHANSGIVEPIPSGARTANSRCDLKVDGDNLNGPAAPAGEVANWSLSPFLSWPRLRAEAGGLWRSSLSRTVAAFFGANMFAVGVRVISGLLVTRWAGPTYMGFVLAVTAVLPFANIVRLGTIQGTSRQLPLLLGKGDHEHALRVANAAYWWTRWTAFAIGLACAIAAIWLLMTGRTELGTVWLLYALLAPVGQLRDLIQVTYRTSGDFLKLSRISIIESGLAVATVALLLVSPWWGLLARLFVLGVSEFVLLRVWQPIPLAPRFDRQGFGEVVRVGLPMFGVAYVQGILNNIDRTLMLVLLGASALGMYAPALQISIAAMVLPVSIQQVLYPRMCKIFGETGSARSLARLAFGPAMLLAVALLPIFAAGWWLVDPFIRLVLPQFTEGISAARWMVVLLYFRSLGGPRLVFPTLNRMDLLGGLTVFATVVSIGAAWLLVEHSGLGIAAVPAGCAIGAFTYNLAGSMLSGWLIFGSASTGRVEK